MRDGAKLEKAREFRKSESVAEKRLWEQLRNRTLGGFKFVRQAPVGPYIADFLCRDYGLVVEVDGATHSTAAELARDSARTRHLEELGYRIVRFHNEEINNGLDEVLVRLKRALSLGATPSPTPALRAGSPSSPASGRGQEEEQR